MARRNQGDEPVTEAEGTVPEAEATEAEGTAPEATEAPKAEEVVIDLTAFKSAVEAAVAGRDESTGEVSDELVSPVQSAYRDLDGQKAKNQAKGHLNDSMRSAMNEMDISSARAYMVLSDSLTVAAPKTEKAPADPTEAFVQRVATLSLAYSLAVGTVPDGVDSAAATEQIEKALADAQGHLDTYRTWFEGDSETRGDEPEVPSIVKSAFKVAAGKAAGVRKSGGSTYTGERRDIGEHIKQAFADQATGSFLTVAEIRNHKSTEYGDNPPSAGAISARLFPASGKCTVEGVEPGTNESGNRGARKVA